MSFNVCGRGNLRNIAFYFLVVAVFPLIVFLRFLLAPIYIHHSFSSRICLASLVRVHVQLEV